jgi:hypothetical protein
VCRRCIVDNAAGVGIGGAERWFAHGDQRIKVRVAYHPLVNISEPTQFEHKAHIGYNAEGKFDVRNLPPQWKGILLRALFCRHKTIDISFLNMLQLFFFRIFQIHWN